MGEYKDSVLYLVILQVKWAFLKPDREFDQYFYNIVLWKSGPNPKNPFANKIWEYSSFEL